VSRERWPAVERWPDATFRGSLSPEPGIGLQGDEWARRAEHLSGCPSNPLDFARGLIPRGPKAGIRGGYCCVCGAMVVEEDARVIPYEDGLQQARRRAHEARTRLRAIAAANDRSQAAMEYARAVEAAKREAAALEAQVRKAEPMVTRDVLKRIVADIEATGDRPTVRAVARRAGVPERTLYRHISQGRLGARDWPWSGRGPTRRAGSSTPPRP